MANKYSKTKFAGKDTESKKSNGNSARETNEFEEKRRRLNRGAKIMAIVVSIAMIVTAFLSAGVFFLK